MEVAALINRPLYMDKIMPYVDTPFVKILTGIYDFENDYGTAEM